MLDFLLGTGLVVALFRGYSRGFVRGALGLLVTLAAIWFGYRAGPLVSGVVQSWSGAGPVAGRIAGSVLVFGAILVVGTFVAQRSVSLPGPLRMLDRVAGALVSGVWYVVLVILLLLVAGSIPNLFPGADGLLSESRAARLITAEEAPVAPAVSRLFGDRVIESLVNLNRLVGQSQVVLEGADRVDIPRIAGVDLHDSPESARELFERLNRTRFEEGLPVLSWSGALAEVAGGHGREMYREGYFSHVSPTTGSVDRRLDAVGIPFFVVGENLALSPTVDSVHEGLVASPSHRATMLDPRFKRVGISAVEGPLGLMVVQVFSG